MEVGPVGIGHRERGGRQLMREFPVNDSGLYCRIARVHVIRTECPLFPGAC
ncbi:hypothetical protein SAMN06265360_101234 [Haloechinothrix alba]|uniref:Uncharacterized protein n=1 Tax=Haloechinothrix alba TaxID=664784 RepID=A0A238V2T4_9PSEU|nr:hypothetical protein SAMN06265360_101234 [Haloechinothrix alba]